MYVSHQHAFSQSLLFKLQQELQRETQGMFSIGSKSCLHTILMLKYQILMMAACEKLMTMISASFGAF